MKNKYQAMVLSCIDPRFQSLVYKFLKTKNLIGKYSAFTIAGASIGVTHIIFKIWHKTFYDNLATSISLHKIKKLIIIDHHDCGAAKIASKKKKLNQHDETNIHIKSFIKLYKVMNKKFPKLKTEFYLISLNGKVKKYNNIFNLKIQ